MAGDIEYALHKKNRNVHIEHLDDIHSFSMYEVAKATYNFSDYNKIGEGGFGPVYKVNNDALINNAKCTELKVIINSSN